jgi:hypothetical protein
MPSYASACNEYNLNLLVSPRASPTALPSPTSEQDEGKKAQDEDSEDEDKPLTVEEAMKAYDPGKAVQVERMTDKHLTDYKERTKNMSREEWEAWIIQSGRGVGRIWRWKEELALRF